MIVQEMSSKELLKEILSDDKTISKIAFYRAQEMRHEVLKSKTKHVLRAFNYLSNQHNKWIIVIDCHKKKQEFYSFVHFHNNWGFNAIQVNSEGSLTHLSGHFLDRYNERYLKLKDVTNIDLLKRFVVENPFSVVKYSFQPDSTRNIIFCRFKEGIALGDEEVFNATQRIVHFKTFISNEMIHEDQLNDFEILGKLYESELQGIQKIQLRRA